MSRRARALGCTGTESHRRRRAGTTKAITAQNAHGDARARAASGAVAPRSRPRRGARPLRRRALRRLLIAGGAVAALFAAVFAAGAIYVATLPGVGDARQRVEQILDVHHGAYSGRVPPVKLAKAVVAVEDEHFYSDFFVNIADGAGRAALAALQTNQDPGGSTIAQQLAKQLYGHGNGLSATLEEIGLGVKLSLDYPQAQILNMYLNAVYYGNGYWGDLAAAGGYFGTTPARLDWAQAAMLAGLPQAPSQLDPLEHYGLAKLRQRHVLNQLVVNHYLTRAEANAAYAQPLDLK